MPAQLTILAGPPRSGKTERLLAHYRSALVQGSPGAGLWLVPTWRAAAEVRARLVSRPFQADNDGLERPSYDAGYLAPGVATFAKFAAGVLEHLPEAIRPIGRLMKRQLVRRLIDEHNRQGRLQHFRPIAGTAGLVDLVCEFISELKRLEIWPEHFRQACDQRGITDKDQELFELYEGYQQSLREANLYDAEGLLWTARDWLDKSLKSKRPPPGMKRFWDRLRLVVADGFTDFTRTQHEILEILARRAEEVFVALPLEAEPRRADLFAKPLKTLEELRRRFRARTTVEELPRPNGDGARADAASRDSSDADTGPRPVPVRTAWPAMEHLERSLFGNPRQAVPAADARGIEILAAARPIGEIQLIAARIKRLLADGEARPGDVAVVFRSPPDADSLVAEVFGELGIPFALETGQTLDRAPALRALIALLQLEENDWPALDLLAVLGNNYFQPNWNEWDRGRVLADIERAVRKLQIPHGKQRLLELTSREPEERGLPRIHAVLGRLAAAFDELPQKATLAEWAKAWQRLAGHTGLHRAMTVRTPHAPREQRTPHAPREGGHHAERDEYTRHHAERDEYGRDRLAWDRLQAALVEGDRLERWQNRRAPELDRREALAALLDILQSERLGGSGDETGRVRVLSAASVRGLRVPYLFLAGLAEKAFPMPDREDSLYGEAEYQRLIEHGLPLANRTERNREEMLLFYEAVTRAARRLFLSYPALDDAAQPLSPSPYLLEVEQACGKDRIARHELLDLSPVPTDDEPLSDTAFRLKAIHTALEGNVALLAGLIGTGTGRGLAQRCDAESASSSQPAPRPRSDAVDNLLAALQLTYDRQDREHFGPAEGLLLGKPARAWFAERYGAARTFSATELENYAACPYRFFLERVLKVEPIEDLALAVDFMQRGQLAHAVLAEFHRRVHETLGRPGSPLEVPSADFDRLLQEAFQAALPPPGNNPVEAALREVDRRLLLQWLADYRRQHEEYDSLWKDCDAPLRPEFFEVSFGRGEGDCPNFRPSENGTVPLGAKIGTVPDALELTTDKQTIRLSGRIDRIDTGRAAGHAVFNVLDYKTGGRIALGVESVAAGLTLQLPLYAFAAAELLLNERDAVPWRAGYWYLRDGGFKPRQALTMYDAADGRIAVTDDWEQIRDSLAETVAALVERLRAGQFPVFCADQECTGRCPLKTVCRINHIRSLEKTWPPAA